MNLIDRLKNIYRLSGMVETEFVPMFEKTKEVLDRMEKEIESRPIFIARASEDPIKILTEELP